MKMFGFVIAMLGLAGTAGAQTSLAVLCQPRVDEKYSEEFLAKCSGTIDYEAYPEPVGPAGAPAGTETAPMPKPSAPTVGSGEGEDLDDLERETGGIQTQYNEREMVKVGEFDALQGRPVNMQHASNLEYLQGYTQGQRKKAEQTGMRGGMQGGVPPRPRGGIQLQ